MNILLRTSYSKREFTSILFLRWKNPLSSSIAVDSLNILMTVKEGFYVLLKTRIKLMTFLSPNMLVIFRTKESITSGASQANSYFNDMGIYSKCSTSWSLPLHYRNHCMMISISKGMSSCCMYSCAVNILQDKLCFPLSIYYITCSLWLLASLLYFLWVWNDKLQETVEADK